MILVVDYGMGNLRSVSKALESLRASVCVSSDPGEISRADKVILPGVGAFGAAMRELSARRLVEPVKSAIASGKPYLGICLGLQLLFESSEEAAGVPGLGVLDGGVKRFAFHSELQTPPARLSRSPGRANSELKIPHMGWNQVTSTQHIAHSTQKACPLLKEIPQGSFFYFVHSYYADPADQSVVALETDYGGRFAAMVWRNNVFATQFHPEKSQGVGLQLLKNFIQL